MEVKEVEEADKDETVLETDMKSQPEGITVDKSLLSVDITTSTLLKMLVSTKKEYRENKRDKQLNQ